LFLCLKEFLVGQSLRSDQETKRNAGLTERHTEAGLSCGISPLIYMVTMWRSSLMSVPTWWNKFLLLPIL
jgi:hypothetical protein